MTSKVGTVIAFIVGAAIGGVVAWKLVKGKYEEYAQEEIDSVKDTFAKKEATLNVSGLKIDADGSVDADGTLQEDPRAIVAKDLNKPNVIELAKKINDKKAYTEYAKPYQQPVKEPDSDESDADRPSDEPYTIAPEDFGEKADYGNITLLYFADEVVTDEDYCVIDNVDDVIGLDSLKKFGEYEDDSIFVRNDARRVDYQVLIDNRGYHKDVKNSRKPHEILEE